MPRCRSIGTVPKSDYSKPLSKVSFHCARCKWTFDAAPSRVDNVPDQEHHPYAYFAQCEICHEEIVQSPWERALIKAWQNATGPKTPEGKAATAANLEGHPTPEEAKRTRFNAMKHGLYAQTATYFPAKPDGYSFCKGCDVERDWCREQPACVKQTETFMLHQAAFEQRDPKRLTGIYGNLQAALFAVLQQILQTIIADGVKITTPVWYQYEGRFYLAEYDEATSIGAYGLKDEHLVGSRRRVVDITAHPLFKPLGDLLSKANLSLADMGMTTKVLEQAEDFETGFKKGGDAPDLGDVQKKAVAALENLAQKVEAARLATDRDPILVEFRQAQGEER